MSELEQLLVALMAQTQAIEKQSLAIESLSISLSRLSVALYHTIPEDDDNDLSPSNQYLDGSNVQT